MKCKATKKDGIPCSLPAVYHDGTCWAHSEKNAEARRRGSSRGGRNKSVGELAMLKDKLVQLGDDVLNGAMDKGRASVAAVCYGTAIKAVEAEIKARELVESRLVETQLRIEEQRELVGRLEELESLLAEKNEARRGWLA
jgi:hypothetical protein